MLWVCGVGAAYPDEHISNDFLVSLGVRHDQLENGSASVVRRTTLPLAYIASTYNIDLTQAGQIATESATALGARAAKIALERAGILPSQIGLVLCDCLTLSDVVPAEAQRVACALGLKVTAYDLIGASSAVPLFLDTLSKWRPELLPEYILCVSTNTPTQLTNYQHGLERVHLGDGAGAIVISSRHEGKLRLAAAHVRNTNKDLIRLPINSYIHFNQQNSESLYKNCQELAASLLHEIGNGLHPTKLIMPAAKLEDFSDLLEDAAIVQGATRPAEMFGGYPLGVLSEVWDQLAVGENLLMLTAGAGRLFGGCVFRS